uniref:hypothetical protein n=1 Tax=Algoriphagus sp. TaxID=1872435 RepID=UPI004047939F
MESNFSEILKTAIELDELIIEQYLIEQQRKSSDSSQIFFGKLKRLIRMIKQEQPSALKWIFHENSGGWFEEYGLINWSLDKDAAAFGLSNNVFIEHLEELCRQFDLVAEIVNRLFEQSISGSEAIPIIDCIEEGQEGDIVPLKNEFNRMSIDHVCLFFTPLIETENNQGDKWMTPESFEIFLRRSFGKELSLSKPEIKLGKRTKGAIIKLFYEFYSHCIEKNYSSKREKKPYVNLLMDAFNTGIFDNLDDDSFNGKAEWDWPDFKSKLALFQSKLKP